MPKILLSLCACGFHLRKLAVHSGELASHRLPLKPKDDGLDDGHGRDNHGAHGSGNGEPIDLHGMIRQGAESPGAVT